MQMASKLAREIKDNLPDNPPTWDVISTSRFQSFMKANQSCVLDLDNKEKRTEIAHRHPSVIPTHGQGKRVSQFGLETVGLGDKVNEDPWAPDSMGHGASPLKRLPQQFTVHKSSTLVQPPHKGCYIRVRNLVLID